MKPYIVSHVSPDWDAITSLWLLRRFSPFQDAEIVLVNTGNPDRAVLDGAAAVVDTGGVYDPAAWRFDHHHLTGLEARLHCAAFDVYAHLLSGDAIVFHLRALIALVMDGDLGAVNEQITYSRDHGMHALLSAWSLADMPDAKILEHGFMLLDRISDVLMDLSGIMPANQIDMSDVQRGVLSGIPGAYDQIEAYQQVLEEARHVLEQHVVYQSGDGLLVALENAPQQCSRAAFEQGARLVVFHSIYPGIPTVAVGISRHMEWREPHIGELVEGLKEAARKDDAMGNIGGWSREQIIFEELESWFLHPAGFYAGRGGPKAPSAVPLNMEVREIARALDAAWAR